MKGPSPKTATTLLGLVLDGTRLDLVSVKRTAGAVEVRKSVSVTLTLDPLTNEPDLVGAEIQTHLEKAGLRDRRCVVGVPLSWALTLAVKVPAGLGPEDVQSLLAMEAERGLPYAPETLMVSSSLVGPADGERMATLVAIPRDHITRLQEALESIGLRPLSFSLGLAALQPVAESETAGGVVALVAGERGAGLQVTACGGVAALRLLEGAFEQEGPERRVQKDYVARELRITLGQLPEQARGAVRNLKVFGHDELAEELYEQVRPRAEALGLRAQLVKEFAPLEFGPALPNGTGVSAALALAARHLAGQPAGFEFLPPRVSKWKQFTEQHASKKLVYVAAVLGLVLLVVAGMFGWQQWRLNRLETQWLAMEKPVNQIREMEARIRKYRPWYDETYRSLAILKAVTQAFPEDSSVSAKSIEIRDRAGVTVTGTARNNQAFLRMRDQLTKNKQVHDLKGGPQKSAPNTQFVEFTFNFHWTDAQASR